MGINKYVVAIYHWFACEYPYIIGLYQCGSLYDLAILVVATQHWNHFGLDEA